MILFINDETAYSALQNIERHAPEALQDSPVVLINGPRQTGKSPLAKALRPDRRYLTLDAPAVLVAAKIMQFIAQYNENKKPFIWTKSVENILEKVQRVQKALALNRLV